MGTINKIEKIESLLNFDDMEIDLLYRAWDKGNCSLVGLVEIYLFQCIKEHKEENGPWYDQTVDDIKLRIC